MSTFTEHNTVGYQVPLKPFITKQIFILKSGLSALSPVRKKRWSCTCGITNRVISDIINSLKRVKTHHVFLLSHTKLAVCGKSCRRQSRVGKHEMWGRHWLLHFLVLARRNKTDGVGEQRMKSKAGQAQWEFTVTLSFSSLASNSEKLVSKRLQAHFSKTVCFLWCRISH